MKTKKTGEKGIALLMVMTAVLALTIMVVEFVYSTRLHYNMALNLRDRLQAEYLARSAVQLSFLVVKFQKQLDTLQAKAGNKATILSQGSIFQQIPIDSSLLRLALASKTDGGEVLLTDQERKQLATFLNFTGNFAAKITDEQGKINLNALAIDQEQAALASEAGESVGATPTPTSKGTSAQEKLSVAEVTIQQLLALTEPVEFDFLFPNRITRAEVIYNMLDWVDPDSERSGFSGGIEDSIYANQNPPYSAKNAKFSSVRELGLVEGVSDAFLETFEPELTVYGKNNKININTASVKLLNGLIGKLIKSKNQEEIDKIVDWIDENRNFKDQQAFLQGMQTVFGFEANDLDASLLSALTFKPGIFSIFATGTTDEETATGVSATIRAVVSYASTPQSGSTGNSFPGGFQVLYWRVE